MLTMKYIEQQDIKDNITVIKINETYYEGISAEALYDYTRGIWYRNLKSVSDDEYALSVVNTIVIEVYKIDHWVPGTKAAFKMRKVDPKEAARRIAFVGKVAEDSVRNRYIGKSVSHLYKRNASNPCVSFKKYSK